MSILLKENECAEQIIESREIGNKQFETLRLVARYYIDNGYSNKEAREKLERFILQCDPKYNLVTRSDYLDNVMSSASRRPAVNIDYISISDAEMSKVDSLQSVQARRLAFTLLCLSKYWHEINHNSDYWVNSQDKDIMAMANINTSLKRQGMLYWTLHEAGMVQFSKKVDNTNVRVCFVEDGETVLHITDFRNLGYQYLMYHGEPYFECANCGITTKIKNPNSGRRQKYCNECAAKIQMRQIINSAMRRRYKGVDGCDTSSDIFTVYMHQCPNKKRYVGMTRTTLHSRWKNGAGYIDNKAFYSDIKKYGWEKTKHYKIAVTQDENLARDIESYYIQRYKTTEKKNGYNRVSGKLVHGYDDTVVNAYTPIEVDGMGYETT